MNIKDKTKYISRQKVHDTILNYGYKLRQKDIEKNNGFYCLEFDGRKDTISLKNCKTTKDENVSVIAQPGNVFVDFFRPENGRGLTHACHLSNIIKERKSKETLHILKFDQCKADLNAFLQGELGKY